MQTLTFLFAFIAVLALIGVAAWLVRRFANNRLGTNTQRGRMPRLAVIDAAAVDGRRRLVLVRRDNVEHLLMIGGPSDIVVEPNIVRAMPSRDQMAAQRSAAAEQAPRIAPLPDPAWSDEAARADLRSTDAFDHHAEPQMPEPPPRSSRPSFADDIRRPAPPPMPERRSDPLTGFAPESISGRAEPASPRLPRAEPMMPRPQRPGEPPKGPSVREAQPVREAAVREAPPIREALPGREAPPVRETPPVREAPQARAPERAAAPPPPPPPAPPPAPAPSSADQNLAEMAQRLEAALRRPAEPVAPPVAPETPPPARTSRNEPPAPTPAPQKSGFENLEDEMASLLGRPKNPS
jgi:flagellar protein FliO/FliZ